jgi:hypothetical protein
MIMRFGVGCAGLSLMCNVIVPHDSHMCVCVCARRRCTRMFCVVCVDAYVLFGIDKGPSFRAIAIQVSYGLKTMTISIPAQHFPGAFQHNKPDDLPSSNVCYLQADYRQDQTAVDH